MTGKRKNRRARTTEKEKRKRIALICMLVVCLTVIISCAFLVRTYMYDKNKSDTELVESYNRWWCDI